MRRGVLLLALLIVVITAVTASAALLEVNSAGLQVFSFPAHIQISPIFATVEIQPERLQKKSKGGPVTAFIELPQGFDVNNIALASVRLCLGASPCGTSGVPVHGKAKVGDANANGIPDLKVTFDRTAVIALLSGVQTPATVTFTVSGVVNPPNRIFAGSDTVNVVDPSANDLPVATGEASPTP